MKNNQVEELEYENIYKFSCQAENKQDFVDRLKIVSSTIVLELARRINKYQPKTIHKIAKIIDQYNDEIVVTVRNINTTKIIENQPPVMENILMSLVALNNAKLYDAYVYVKKVLPN